MTAGSRLGPLVLLGVLVALLFLELPGSWLVDPDESRYAEIPREMLASGDFTTPTLNGSHYFEKPPLLYWLNAASITAFGRTPFAARLPVRLAAIGTVLLLLFALPGPDAPTAGAWAALVFLSSPLGFVLGRLNLTDGVLSFALTLAFLALRGFLRERETGGRAVRFQVLFALGMGLAVLAKGLVGIVLPAAVLVLWCAILGRWRRVREIVVSRVPIVFVAVAAPWFLLVERANPGFSFFFFVHEHVLRYASHVASRPGPITYFAAVFAVGFLPWTILFAGALAPLVGARRSRFAACSDDLFFALWFLVILVFFSLSHSKLIPYILPALPAAAALTGRAIARANAQRLRPLFVPLAAFVSLAVLVGIAIGLRGGWLERYGLEGLAGFGAAALIAGAWIPVLLRKRRLSGRLLASAAGWAGFYAAIVLALPHVSRDLSAHDLAVAASRAGDAQVACYHCYPQSFPWVLGRPVPVAYFRDELASDGRMSDDLFWSRDAFWRRWESGERLVAVAPRKDLAEFTAPAAPRGTILDQNASYFVIANFLPAGRTD